MTMSSVSRQTPLLAVKKEPSWSAPPPRRTRCAVLVDVGTSTKKIKTEDGEGSSATPARQMTEEEAEALFQAQMAEATRLSFNTVQPASLEYAEAFSAREAGIVVLSDDEAEPPATGPDAGEVKEEPTDDWDEFYRHFG